MAIFSHNIALTFLTVVKASARRFIDVDAQTLASLRDGQRLYIESVKRTFTWSSTSNATNDNTTAGTVLQATATVGAGRAIWDGVVSPEWVLQVPAMVVDTSASGYEGIGNAADPLPTNAELMRRHGLVCQLKANFAITWNTTTATSDPWSGKFIIGPGATFSRFGKKLTTVASATTAFTAVNRTPGAQAMPTITDGTATWVAGQHGSFTSGAAAGAFFVVLKDLTGGVARISTPVTFNTSTQTVTRQTPGNVSNYELYTFPQVTVGTVEMYAADTSITTSLVVDDTIEWRQPQTFNAAAKWVSKGIEWSSQRTTFFSYNADTDGHARASCYFSGGPVFKDSLQCKTVAGGSSGNITILAGGIPTFDMDFCCQGGGMFTQSGCTTLTIGTMSIFDSAGGLTLNPGATALCLNLADGAGTVWGTTTSGFGVTCKSNSQFVYNVAGNKPVINSGLGAGRESKQGGVDVLWAAVPVAMNVNNAAGICLNA